MKREQTKNRLAYLRKKRRKLVSECKKSGQLPEEYKILTHDITVCEINLIANE